MEIQEGIKALIEIRTESISTKIRQNDKYCEIGEKASRIYKEIKNMLPDEHKKLILEYNDTLTMQGAIEEKIYYSQGLKDGLEFMKQL